MIVILNFSYFLWVFHGHRLVFFALYFLSSTREETKKKKMTAANARSFEQLVYNKAI